VTLTSGGSNYTGNPAVTFTGDGSGAAATATVNLSTTTVYPVASVVIDAGGTGYTSGPTVGFSGGGGSGAAANASISQTTTTTYSVASVTVNTGGSGYSLTTPPTVSFSGGGGSGAVATATVGSMPSGLYWVSSITVDTPGSGYTTNPTVILTGGNPTTLATATAQVSGGTKYGQVWVVTAFAQTKTGARSMLQQEVASPVMGFAPGGALTLLGPNPIIDAMPNSNQYYIKGDDKNSCMDPISEPVHPAIDGYDDPNADPPTQSVQIITGSLPKPDHYLGAGGTPSVQNGYASLGESMTTPTGLNALIGNILSQTPTSSQYTTATSGSFDPSTTTLQSITYVNGDLTLSGNPVGNGILVVTGTLRWTGDFTWNGVIFVVGDGNVQNSGGGNTNINGSLYDAKIWDSYATMPHPNLLPSLGSPEFKWNGGGGNGIQYDHCLVTNLMTKIPSNYPPSTRPLKILSFRTLPY
jgi:hypothetical protein